MLRLVGSGHSLCQRLAGSSPVCLTIACATSDWLSPLSVWAQPVLCLAVSPPVGLVVAGETARCISDSM